MLNQRRSSEELRIALNSIIVTEGFSSLKSLKGNLKILKQIYRSQKCDLQFEDEQEFQTFFDQKKNGERPQQITSDDLLNFAKEKLIKTTKNSNFDEKPDFEDESESEKSLSENLKKIYENEIEPEQKNGKNDFELK